MDKKVTNGKEPSKTDSSKSKLKIYSPIKSSETLRSKLFHLNPISITSNHKKKLKIESKKDTRLNEEKI